MHRDPGARVTHIHRWDSHVLIALHAPEIASEARPGQFVMIRTSDLYHPLLRRPFSIHAVSGPDFSIFFQAVGIGTERLARSAEGESLDVIGPLGRGFSLAWDQPGAAAALVGGGRGIAPLNFLAERLAREKAVVRIYYGGRTADDLVLRERLQDAGFEVLCTTDDGSFGFEGLVTDRLKGDLRSRPPDRMYACGPDGMLRTVGDLSAAFGIPAELSLEAVMGCGFGACWGCVHRIRREGKEDWVKICEQGPVFPAGDVVWESAPS